VARKWLMNGQTILDLLEKQMIFIHYFLKSYLSVYASFSGKKPLIEELQNFLENKMLNPQIPKDAFLVAMPTSFVLDMNFSL